MFLIFYIWIFKKIKIKKSRKIFICQSLNQFPRSFRGNPGAGSQQRHHLLALITDSLLYLFLHLWQIKREACALVITAQVWKVSFFYWFVLMTLGKSLNASAELSAWDQDPSYTVRLQKQRRNVYEHLITRLWCVYLGNHIWMGFSVWERLQPWGVVLVCISDMKLYHCLGSYS